MRPNVNVLIVEDDESVAGFLEQAMVEAGHDTRVVGDGTAGSEAAMSEAFEGQTLHSGRPERYGFRRRPHNSWWSAAEIH